MAAVTHDAAVRPGPPTSISGIGIALLSAIAFGTSGTLARPLLEAGWSPGAVVLVRIGLGALVVVPFGLVALRGRWRLLRRRWGTIALYGLLAVAGTQFCYFSAVEHLRVGPALLIEYTAPAAVVCWMWLRHGERPGPLTLAGAVVAALGLLLVLDLFSGAGFDVVGTAWALGAMVGLAAYFVISADEESGLPPLTLAAGGLVVGTATIGLLGLVGALPMQAGAVTVSFSGYDVPWWLPVVLLGLVAAAFAYVSGIEASRRLGSRLASFVGLSEVLAAVLFAWLLLGELPTVVQLVGGVLILLGVIGVKAGERQVTAASAVAAAPTA
jgi:drug/metabolite transporter (DMT)-like permease